MENVNAHKEPKGRPWTAEETQGLPEHVAVELEGKKPVSVPTVFTNSRDIRMGPGPSSPTPVVPDEEIKRILEEAGKKLDGDSPEQRQTMKQKKGKLEYSLVPVAAEQGIASVFAYGAQKYGKRNWEMGFPVSYYMDAIRRHLHAFMCGEDTDPETHLSHLYHVAANAVMCQGNMVEHGYKFDDRRKGVYR